ncbi:hypothetical protein PP1_007120 [Pseudonocardia sp. P1]|nr:Phage protein [Pseudonocardia sp. Ae707_Ps1]
MKTLLGYTNTGHPIYPIIGSDGYHTAGDVVRQTKDGRPLEELWREFNLTIDLVNEERNAIANLLSFPTTLSADNIAQSTDDPGFALASEYGEPTGARPEFLHLKVGFTFRDYDRGARYTWRYLRDAHAAQVEQTHRSILTADFKNVSSSVLARLLNPVQTENEDGVPCYGLYNGDVMVPPRYQFRTFDGPHSHYLTTQAPVASGADLDDMAKHITEHGYAVGPGRRLLLFVHPDDLAPLAAARVGDEDGSAFDFIASGGAPAYLTTESLVGERPPAVDENGLEIAGSYGRVWICPTEFMPPGYLLMSASDGAGGLLNPVGLRQHTDPAWHGLKLIPGNQQGYPLVDAYYARAFGVGVRHRGAAVAMQITTNTDYTPPEAFAGVFL